MTDMGKIICSKCKQENLENTSTCFYCDQDLSKQCGNAPVKEVGDGKKWRPDFVDIHLPRDEGLIRILFKNEILIQGNKIRLLYRGNDGKFRGIKDITSPQMRALILELKRVINDI